MMDGLQQIETRPVEQADGSIKNFSPGCPDSCFTAPKKGMAVMLCDHYVILFLVKAHELHEFCGKYSQEKLT